jgi:hypothetical protein
LAAKSFNAVIRNGDVVESIERIGGAGLFDDIEHPVIDLFAPYQRTSAPAH